MAEQNPTASLRIATPAKFYSLVGQPPIIYTNAWEVSIGNTEVTLKIGSVVEHTPEEQVVQHAATIIMTHSGFVKMMETLLPAANVIAKIYGGTVPAMDQISQEQLLKIFAEVGANIQTEGQE